MESLVVTEGPDYLADTVFGHPKTGKDLERPTVGLSGGREAKTPPWPACRQGASRKLRKDVF
jgi:hypothetical protein